MCGIAGYIGRQKQGDSRLDKVLTTMDRRGPDNLGSWSYSQRDTYIHLLHSRLSIIDLDARSDQPYQFEHLTLAFNGEIYNYKELREDLKKSGHSFTTNSDTEVVVKAYLQFGKSCVDHFEGMWAFALYDQASNELFMSRDRFGEKPFYYVRSKHGIYFASETRTLRTFIDSQLSVNYEHIMRFCVMGHKSLYKHNSSFYEGIEEIDVASCALVDADLNFKTWKYWEPKFQPREMTENEAIEGIRQHLVESVKLRMRSDVPLAFCLSGGVDSSSLVSIAAKELNYDVNTYSIIDRDARYNELENVEATVKDTGCRHHLVYLDPNENYLDHLRDLVQYHDAPVATLSYLVHSFLSKAIAKDGFKISISGTAADELFTGYYDHFTLQFYELRNSPDLEPRLREWQEHQQKFVRHPAFKQHDFYFDNPNKRDHIYLNSDLFGSLLKKSIKTDFVESQYSDSLLRNRMMNELFHEVVRVILHEDDLNSMKYSLENRSPFLSTPLFEFANSIPSKLLIKNGYAKYLLRESMNGILNDKVRLSREKRGFNASIKSVLDFQSGAAVEMLLSDSPIFDFFDRDKMKNFLQRDSFPNSMEKFIFNFLNSKLFLESQAL